MEERQLKFQELEEVIIDFRNNLVKDFIVGGSMALVMCGGFDLPITDIDIEVEKSNTNVLIGLAFLSIGSPSECKNYSEGSRFDFMYKGVKFNAFVVEKFTRPFVYMNYIKYGTVMSVINHKKAHNRVKDYQAINSIVNELIK